MTVALDGEVRIDRRRRLFAGIVGFAFVLVVGAWTYGLLTQATCACAPTPIPSVSPVDGVVIGVDSAGLGQVRGFTLRPTGVGSSYEFVLGTLENPAEFSPSHLAEHMASSEPIRVWYRFDDGEPVVYRLEDASP